MRICLVSQRNVSRCHHRYQLSDHREISQHVITSMDSFWIFWRRLKSQRDATSGWRENENIKENLLCLNLEENVSKRALCRPIEADFVLQIPQSPFPYDSFYRVFTMFQMMTKQMRVWSRSHEIKWDHLTLTLITNIIKFKFKSIDKTHWRRWSRLSRVKLWNHFSLMRVIARLFPPLSLSSNLQMIQINYLNVI